MPLTIGPLFSLAGAFAVVEARLAVLFVVVLDVALGVVLEAALRVVFGLGVVAPVFLVVVAIGFL